MRLDSLREYAVRQEDETLQAWVRGLAVPLLGSQRSVSAAWGRPLLALLAGAAVFAFLAGLALSGRG